MLPSLAAVGAVAAGNVMLVVEVVADVDVAAEMATEAQAKAHSLTNKVTWLQPNKYNTAKEYAKFTATKKAWIHQHRTKSPAPKHKVAAVLCSEDNTGRESDNNRDHFGDNKDDSILSKRSTWSNLTNPALVHQEKETTHPK